MKTTLIRHVPAWLLLALSATALGGCASARLVRVAAWDRGTLADYSMQPNRDRLATATIEHVYLSRETAAGGSAVGGSGCGCN
jgi:hypothetical protein